MAKDFPTALYFSRQQNFCIWDAGIVLDRVEAQLIIENASYKRLPPENGNVLGCIEIFCTHSEIAERYRQQYQSLRGTV